MAQVERPPARVPAGELADGLVTAAVGAAVLVFASRYPLGDVGHPGPGMWPSILAVALLVLGAAIAARAVIVRVGTGDAEPVAPGRWWRVAATGALLVGFVLVWPQVGWVPAGTVAFGLITRLAGASWLVSGLWALAASAALYGLFALLLEIPL